MRKLAVGILLLFPATICSCAPTRVWTSDPAFQTIEGPQYSLQFTPLKNDRNTIEQFRLLVANRSGRDLEVDWTETRYLLDGAPYGGFVFAGLDPTRVNRPPADIVPPGGTLTKTIAPLKLLAWKPVKSPDKSRPSFSAGPVPAGKNGIYLVLRQGGQVFRERLAVTVRIGAK